MIPAHTTPHRLTHDSISILHGPSPGPVVVVAVSLQLSSATLTNSSYRLFLHRLFPAVHPSSLFSECPSHSILLSTLSSPPIPLPSSHSNLPPALHLFLILTPYFLVPQTHASPRRTAPHPHASSRSTHNPNSPCSIALYKMNLIRYLS